MLKLKNEARYRRSRLKETPESPKDTVGERDMDERLFQEPTLMFSMLRPDDDLFTVVLTPSSIAGRGRWLFFVWKAGRIQVFSFLRSQDGGIDLTGEKPSAFNIPPRKVFSLALQTPSGVVPLAMAGSPASLLFRSQESSTGADGKLMQATPRTRRPRTRTSRRS